MLEAIDNENVPSLPPLPLKINQGLGDLWANSTETDTEWIGAIVSSKIIILGHQSKSSVSIPVIDIAKRARTIGKPLDKTFIEEEIKKGSQDFRETPDIKDGSLYKGRVLFLLSQELINEALVQFAESEADSLICCPDHYKGLAHTHPSRLPKNHLPSLDDVYGFLFGKLPNNIYEVIVSGPSFSALIKSRKTPHYESDPEISIYGFNQRVSDGIKLTEQLKTQPEDIAYLAVLEGNCRKYHLGLFEGDLRARLPLLPVF